MADLAPEERTARCMFTTDQFGAIRETQTGWSQTTGQTFEQYEKWGWIDVIQPDQRNRTYDRWLEIVSGKQAASFEASMYFVSTERHRPAHWAATPLLDEHHQVRNWIVTVFEDSSVNNAAPAKTVDIDHQSLRDDLKCIEKLLSHDMRSPLRKISNYASLLLEDASDTLPEQESERLYLLLRSVQRMQRYVDGLQEYIALGIRRIEVGPVSAADCLARAVGSLADTFQKARFVVSSHDLPNVLANARLLQLVFESLLRNSIAHCGERSPLVLVDFLQQGAIAKFVFRDRGFGVRPEERETIFQPFCAGNNNGGGIGQGLAFCKRALQRMGGDITLTPSRRGACFAIYLPLVNELETKSTESGLQLAAVY